MRDCAGAVAVSIVKISVIISSHRGFGPTRNPTLRFRNHPSPIARRSPFAESVSTSHQASSTCARANSERSSWMSSIGAAASSLQSKRPRCGGAGGAPICALNSCFDIGDNRACLLSRTRTQQRVRLARILLVQIVCGRDIAIFISVISKPVHDIASMMSKPPLRHHTKYDINMIFMRSCTRAI